MLTVISGTTQKPLSRVWTEYVPLQRTLIPRVRMVCRRHLYMMHFGEPSSPRFYMVHQRGLVCALPLVPDSTRSFAGVSATTTVLMTFQFPAIEDLFSDADDTLFERFVYYPAHVLHPIFPAKSEQPYNLRLREMRHNHSLVEKTSELNERDYITRILYQVPMLVPFLFSILFIFDVAFCQLVFTRATLC